MARKKSGNLCTTLGCKTTSDAMLIIMLGLMLVNIVYYVATKADLNNASYDFNETVPRIYGVISVVTLAIILIEKLQKKITMAECGKKVIMTVVYLVLFAASIAIAKAITKMFGIE
ncbi:MAG: hypothetical protein WCI57_05185 [Candidatus Berkelbacteria bacterium]